MCFSILFFNKVYVSLKLLQTQQSGTPGDVYPQTDWTQAHNTHSGYPQSQPQPPLPPSEPKKEGKFEEAPCFTVFILVSVVEWTYLHKGHKSHNFFLMSLQSPCIPFNFNILMSVFKT